MKKSFSWLIVFCLLALGGVFSGCGGSVEEQNTQAKDLLKVAQILYKKQTVPKKEAYVEPSLRQNAEKAFQKYQEIVLNSPKSEYVPQALVNMARIRDEFGPAKEAIPYWLELIYDHPESEYAKEADEMIKKVIIKWMAAAKNHVYRGRYDEAIALYKQVFRVNPYNAEAHLALGEAYAKSARYDEAIREYRVAVDIDPNYVEAQYLLALVYLAKNQIPDALRQLELVVEIKPDMVVAYYNMALIYEEKLNDVKKAKESWGKYLDKAPSLEKEKKWLPTAQYRFKSLS